MLRKIQFLTACCLLLHVGSAGAQEKLPAAAKVKSLEAYPAKINLQTLYDYRQLLLSAVLESGERVDVTRIAQVDKPASLVSLSPTGLLRPLADGSGELRFKLADKSLKVPVTVTGQKEAYKVGF